MIFKRSFLVIFKLPLSGDSKYDSKCAENAGIDFALAVWGSHNKHIKADYFLERPADLLPVIISEKLY